MYGKNLNETERYMGGREPSPRARKERGLGLAFC